MRADYLGSNPVTALLRCPCGRRLFFDKETWADSGFLTCDNCRQIIWYKNLRVFPELGGGVMSEGEMEQLRGVEAEVRDFIEYVDRHVRAAEERGSTLHPFAPRTVETVERLRVNIRRLDELRGGPSAPA